MDTQCCYAIVRMSRNKDSGSTWIDAKRCTEAVNSWSRNNQNCATLKFYSLEDSSNSFVIKFNDVKYITLFSLSFNSEGFVFTIEPTEMFDYMHYIDDIASFGRWKSVPYNWPALQL